MNATTYGCEIVCSCPIDTGVSSYAKRRAGASGMNRWRGTIRIAASTRSSFTPRAAICSSTMRARGTAVGSGAGSTARDPEQHNASARGSMPIL
jgi:hypothetical protein